MTDERIERIRRRLEREATIETTKTLPPEDRYTANLTLGKEWEGKVAALLTSFGYTVEDISERTYTKDGTTSYHYPFDLLFSSGDLRYMADVKFRNRTWIDDVILNRLRVQEYTLFDEIPEVPVENRLLILATPKTIRYCSIVTAHLIDYGKHVVGLTAELPLSYLHKVLIRYLNTIS